MVAPTPDASSPPPPAAPPLIPEGSAGRLGYGVNLPFRAFGYLASRPQLWSVSVVPVILTILGLVGSLWGLWGGTAWVLGLIWTAPSFFLLYAVWWLVKLALFVVLGFVASVAIPIIISVPFTDRLSAKVEALELGEVVANEGFRGFAAEVWVAIGHALVRLLILIAGQLGLLLLNFIPAIGNLAYSPLAFLWSASWLSFQYLDLPMARHLYKFKDVSAAQRSVRPASIGFGSVMAFLLLVPIVNFVFIPIGTTAGTLFYCDLRRAGKVGTVPEAIKKA